MLVIRATCRYSDIAGYDTIYLDRYAVQCVVYSWLIYKQEDLHFELKQYSKYFYDYSKLVKSR